MTATAVLRNAVDWFAYRGMVAERVLSDNDSAYVSHLWRDTCAELGIRHTRTGPSDPRPTARSNTSTGPCPTAGATPADTNQRASAATPCQHGSTGTTATGPTPPARTNYRSPG